MDKLKLHILKGIFQRNISLMAVTIAEFFMHMCQQGSFL